MVYRIDPVRGQYRDILTDAQNKLLYDSGWKTNTIVKGCRILLAGLMFKRVINVSSTENEASEQSVGICHLAVGQGDPNWDDNEKIPSVPENTEVLFTPYEDGDHSWIADLDFTYLDEQNNDSTDATSRLQITADLKPGYPRPLENSDSYPLREFGLFGNFDDNLYMIDCVRHPRIDKQEDATLTRTIILDFDPPEPEAHRS